MEVKSRDFTRGRTLKIKSLEICFTPIQKFDASVFTVSEKWKQINNDCHQWGTNMKEMDNISQRKQSEETVRLIEQGGEINKPAFVVSISIAI